jgi:hypothetical protein
VFLGKRARRTFVIDPDVSEKIDKLTDGHTIEINVLVNKSLRRYMDWGRYVDNFKLVTSDPRLMKTLWSYMTIDEARRLGAENGNDTVEEFILYYFHKFDLESVLKTFRVIGAEYSNSFVYSEFGEKHNRTIILRHSLGHAASAYYGATLKGLFSRLGLDAELEEADDQLICKIRGKDQIAGVVTQKPLEDKIAQRIIVKEES